MRRLVEGIDADFVAVQSGRRRADVRAEGLGHIIATPADPDSGGEPLDLLMAAPCDQAEAAAAQGLRVWLLSDDAAAAASWAGRVFRPQWTGDWGAVCAQVRLALAGAATPIAFGSCKLCGAPAAPAGLVLFDTGDECAATASAPATALVGYHRCGGCGYLFTRDCDRWSAAEMRRRIDGDPSRLGLSAMHVRPWQVARMVAALFPALGSARVLAYGGDAAAMAVALAGCGVRAAAIDPWHDPPPTGQFDLIICAAALERAARPRAQAQRLSSLLAPDGIAVLATLLQPEPAPDLDWWYVAPRLGHIGIHSRASFALLWQSVGLQTTSLTNGIHLAYNTLPVFAEHLVVKNR